MVEYDYDELVKNNTKRNEKYLDGFYKWLTNKKYAKKTIRTHYSNIDFYINIYLTHYEIILAENGMNEAFSFLGDYFIRKCMWSSPSSLKGYAASLKKFYLYMMENNYVKQEDYNVMCSEIKENMDMFLETYYDYYNEDYDEFF